jgi:hypothetical protein
VNKIYGDTEFSAGKYRHAGHTFEVQRIKIYNDSDCTGNIYYTSSIINVPSGHNPDSIFENDLELFSTQQTSFSDPGPSFHFDADLDLTLNSIRILILIMFLIK